VAGRGKGSTKALGVETSAAESSPQQQFQTVKFSADSALLRELGERLVGQPHIALAELIKNAYDADATVCSVIVQPDELIVSDNGHGMTEGEFLNHWMTIGTRNKQEKGVSRGFGRNVTGSKGVGRLSAQFLAHRLQIVTTSDKDEKQQLKAFVNWDEAIEAGKLTEAEARYLIEPRTMTFADGGVHGTRVVMSGLKQQWTEDLIRDLGRQLWMIQSPMSQYGKLSTATADPNAFRVEFTSWKGDLSDVFQKQMTAALQNYDAIISGELVRREEKSAVHIKVVFTGGSTFSESFDVDPLVENARWNIRVFKLQGRQFEGVKVGEARSYFEKFGGVQVYDAGFRLPYYGVQQDWLGIEYDHSHRRNKSSLLPERLHVKRALNDLPTQGRLFGVVAIDTGREARLANERDHEAGDYLKIQVTRDRLVANKAYEVLRDAVRWSLDYYATRERIREESVTDVKRPEEPSSDKVGRIRNLVRQVRQSHETDEVVQELEREVFDLAQTIDDERKSEESARSLLGPLASAGMAALALEHESRKEMRIARGFMRRLRAIAKDLDDSRIKELADQIGAWVERLEGTRKVFGPLLDVDDREQIEAFSLANVLAQVTDNVRPLIPGVNIAIDVAREMVLPPATFAEWNSLFQNVIVNAANATLDSQDRRIQCLGGRTGRTAWLKVNDTGAGIDWEKSAQFFEPFAREMRISRERAGLGLGGMGLGLTIVRMVAELRRCKVQFVEPARPWSTTFQLSWSSSA
jgi:signal transduction histidine kinase